MMGGQLRVEGGEFIKFLTMSLSRRDTDRGSDLKPSWLLNDSLELDLDGFFMFLLRARAGQLDLQYQTPVYRHVYRIVQRQDPPQLDSGLAPGCALH